MNNSILTSHSSKFIYNLWRPYTAIRNADLDLNPGTDKVAVTMVWKGNTNLTPPTPDVEKDFPSLWALAVDEADSRGYGGIHYRFDKDVSQFVCPKVSRFAFDKYMQAKNHGRPW